MKISMGSAMSAILATISHLYADWRANRKLDADLRAVNEQSRFSTKLQVEAARNQRPLTDIQRLALSGHSLEMEAHAEHGNLTIRQRKALAQYDRGDAAAAVRQRNGPRLHTVGGGR